MSLSALKLRFSLRAMLVAMTLFALFLWYHIDWIKQRRAALATGNLFDVSTSDVAAPLTLRPFGEYGCETLIHSLVDHTDDEDLARLQALFPEAEFVTGITPLTPFQWHSERTDN